MGTSRGRGRSARPIVAALVALLIALQSLAAIATSPSHRRGVEASAALAALGVDCNADVDGSHSSPARGQRDHSPCCIFCIARDHDWAPFHDAARSDAAVFYPSLAITRIAGRLIDDPDARPIGWTGAWSSRAPPIFS